MRFCLVVSHLYHYWIHELFPVYTDQPDHHALRFAAVPLSDCFNCHLVVRKRHICVALQHGRHGKTSPWSIWEQNQINGDFHAISINFHFQVRFLKILEVCMGYQITLDYAGLRYPMMSHSLKVSAKTQCKHEAPAIGDGSTRNHWRPTLSSHGHHGWRL